MGLLRHIRRIRAHGYALNFVLKPEWKRLSTRLAYSSSLRAFNQPYVQKPQNTWSGLESFDFMDNFKFSLQKKILMMTKRDA